MMALRFSDAFDIKGSLFERGSVALVDPRARASALTSYS